MLDDPTPPLGKTIAVLDTPGPTSTPESDTPPPPHRPAPPATAEAPRPGRSSRIFAVTGVVIVTLLSAVVLGLAFRSGAYSPADWLPFLIGVAALGLMMAVSGPAVPSGRGQRVLPALFGLLALWTVLSVSWATSQGDTWEEINRTLFYAVAIALVFAAVRWAGPLALRVLAGLLTAVVVIVALVILVQLGTNPDAVSLLPGGRLNYPITYWNGLACFLMIGFWLALGLANGAMEAPRAGRSGPAAELNGAAAAQAPPTAPQKTSTLLLRIAQPVLLVAAVILLEIMLLPQSRGALWTFFLVIPVFVILSPNRFRALADLGIVVLPLILFWGRLNGVYVAVRDKTPLDAAIGSALRAVGWSVLIVLVAWAVTYAVERFAGPLSRRVRRLVGAVLIVVAVGAAVGGLVYLDIHTGGLGGYLGDRWTEFTSDTGTAPAESGSRFAAFGLNGRLTQWKVAAKAFEEHPVLGIGAQNFEVYYYLHRTTLLDVRNPHSQPVQLLAELGFPGLALYAAFVVLTLVRAAVLRFKARNRLNMAVMAAMITACLCWFIHSSADWLWQLAAVTLPAMMLFAGLIGVGSSTPRRAARAAARHSAPRRQMPPWTPRVTRWGAAVLAALVIVSAGLPYLSLRFSNLAAGSTDLAVVISRTKTAAWLDPTAVHPFATRAAAYTLAAQQEAEGSRRKALDLQLAADAWEDATRREPDVWLNAYMAAQALVTARDASLAADMPSDAPYLTGSAKVFLDTARQLNPLSPQVKALEERL